MSDIPVNSDAPDEGNTEKSDRSLSGVLANGGDPIARRPAEEQPPEADDGSAANLSISDSDSVIERSLEAMPPVENGHSSTTGELVRDAQLIPVNSDGTTAASENGDLLSTMADEDDGAYAFDVTDRATLKRRSVTLLEVASGDDEQEESDNAEQETREGKSLLLPRGGNDGAKGETPEVAEQETAGENSAAPGAGSNKQGDTQEAASVGPVSGGTDRGTVSGVPSQAVKPAKRRPRSKRRRIISLVLLGILLLGILVPVVMAVSYGVRAYTTYNAVRGQAYSGIQHLMNIKTIFTGVKAHPTGMLDVAKLHLAQKELTQARVNFKEVQFTLNHSDIVQTVTNYLSQYRPQIATARAASQMGIDAIDIGQELVSTALILAPKFQGPLLTDGKQPLITQSMLDLIGKTIDDVLPRLNDIETQSHQFSLSDLPGSVSASQRGQLLQLLQALPQVQADLTQVRGLLGAAGWLLGVNAPRTFLVQTMDRAELRPTGGFTGQYGELQIDGGRVAPFSLKDISFIEYVDNSPTLGQLAPPQYRSWWPFANWGLRDSNLSADFPTSAQIAINEYKHEVGHQVDGVILFTPFFIEHVLDAVGPIELPAYHETITSQNLEERLHYYQQDNSGIRKQEIVQHVDPPAAARKLFTALLAHTLMDRVRQAPPDEILAIAREALHDLKTKDLQVYVTNSQVEGLLAQYGDAAQMDRSTTHDGLYVVQANINATKASQYVRTVVHDTVTLNGAGGATHVMQLRLAFTQTGPTYGYDAYRDYVRVYVPATSQYLWGDGFDTGIALCGGPAPLCPQTDVYPRDELLCPPGQFQPGAASPSLADENGGRWHPLDTVGPPPNRTSDEPGRAMFGGWVVVPKNCTMTVTLSWYVPPMGPGPYNLLVQRQAGTFPELDLTILPTPGDCARLRTQGQHFDDLLTQDTFFALKTFRPTVSSGLACYPRSGV